MDNFSVKKFVELSNNDSNVKEKIEIATNKIRNGEDVKRIISKEIIPISREKGFSFTTDEFLEYLNERYSFNAQTAASASKNSSVGGKAKKAGKVVFGLLNTAASIFGIAQTAMTVANASQNTSSAARVETNVQNQSQEDSAKTGSDVKGMLGKDGRGDGATQVQEGSGTTGEERNGKSVLENTEYEVARINFKKSLTKDQLHELEEERIISIKRFRDSSKVFSVPNKPLTVEGKWLPTGRATYSATVFILPKGSKCDFNAGEWEKIDREDGVSFLVKKGTKAHKYIRAIFMAVKV